ncbi:hypothetical protein OIO90_001529 [Microbotryomycetes sp. JL221]|nr:hypothetical protein OIO90_001529 [Microbotryomycetes sp. JL221]
MPVRYHIVDAFTKEAFTGNPASVICGDVVGEDKFQLIAREFNLAETAFTKELEDHTPQKPHLELRWFTPWVEVPLCGHATLATTAVLFSDESPIKISPEATEIVFESIKGAGTLVAKKLSNTRFSLDFPAEDVSKIAPVDSGPEFDQVAANVLQACPELKGHIVKVTRLTQFGLLVEISTDINLEVLKVDAEALMKDKQEPLLNILTQPTPSDASKPDRDVQSRVFAPCAGVSEDPVTGAAHTCIAPYWLHFAKARLHSRTREAIENGTQTVLKCRQVSARGGDVDVTYDAKNSRVHLAGDTNMVMRGEIL